MPLFFAAVLLLGLIVSRDYGVSWDEGFQRGYGQTMWEYVADGNRGLFSSSERAYGPVFVLSLTASEKLLHLTDTRDIYLFRHACTFFLFWVGLVFFYRFGRRMFGSWKAALLACIFLLLSPRIFAHAFYNPKDIPFLALWAVGMDTLFLLLEKKTIARAMLHAAVCGLLVDLRVVGLLLSAITFLLLLADTYPFRKRTLKDHGTIAVAYGGITAFIIVACWPYLWEAPFGHLWESIEKMSHFPWNLGVFFRGAYVPATQLPPWYIPLWILLTTPVLYSLAFVAGIGAEAAAIMGGLARFWRANRGDVIALAWLCVPLASLFLLRPVVYDEWRHFFFLYPAIVLIAVRGILSIDAFLHRALRDEDRRAARLLVRVACGLSCATTLAFMLRNHPFENTYFSMLPGGIRGAEGQYELDYWGTSYRQAWERLLREVPQGQLLVHVENDPGRLNLAILPATDRKRITLVDRREDAEYSMTNFRWQYLSKPSLPELFSIRVDDIPILAVYRVKAKKP